MNHDPNDIKNGELDQSRLTAYALEQLEGAERAAVEALLAGSDRSRHTVEEIRALAAEVKKAAHQEALPPRSPELRVVLEQYPGNEEVTEMNAKPEPSSAKAPRHGRRRSTLIWAAAVCALVAAIPGYVLISGSLGPDLQTVALDGPAAETSADAYSAMRSSSEFSYEGSEGVRFADAEPRGDVAQVRDASIPAKGKSPSLRHGKRDELATDSAAPASGEKAQPVTARRLVERPSKPAPAAVPAEPRPVRVTGKALGVSSKLSVDVGMEAPGVFSADLDIPYSKDNYGAQVPPSGGMDARGPATTALQSTVRESEEIPTNGKPLYATKNPRSRGVGGASAPTAGGRGGMMGGGMGGMRGTAPAGPGMGMDGMSIMEGMMGMPGASAKSGSGNEQAVEQNGRSMYAIINEKAPTGGRPVTDELQLQMRKPASAAQQSPVEVERLGELDVIIVKGKAKDTTSESEWGMELGLRDEKLFQYEHGRSLYQRSPGTEQYDPIVENPFLSAADNPESTFSVDVDSASYANVRRFLDSGRLPPPNAVRIEELVNYFRYDYPQPDGEVPFSVNMETAQCPWDTEHRLVRIGLKGREIDPEQRGPSNLVFLLDVSGSMRDENKLPLVQYAMNMLVDQLTEDDRVAIVTYAGDAGVALDSTSGEKRKKIRRAIDNLSAGGSTHGSAGIVMAYDQAMQHLVKNGTNRVILCTDGDLNVGITSDDELVKLIGQQAKSGVFLTVLGFGTGNLQDSKMEKLADKGNGIYAYVDGRREARRVLVEQMAGSLVTIAKDVKIQIEFNPAEVKSYRLIGYENRIMAAEDFANDKKDAGEIGAGHTVTALYEIVPGGTDSGGELGRELKYQRKTGRELTEAATSGELLTLKLRYKEPEGKKSNLLELVQKDSDKRFGQASADFRFASSVAAFGMLLRGSQHAGDLTWSAVEEFAAGSLGEDPGGYRNEFLELVHRAGELGSR